MAKSKKNNRSGLPSLVRETNLQTVIRHMRKMELFSKIDLVRECGISTTTMSKLFAQLERSRIIKQSSERDRSFGRPKILYQLCTNLQIAAIVIDIDQTTLCFSSLRGEVSSENMVSFPTGDNPDQLFRHIAEKFSFLRKTLGAECRLVGVCIPGLIEKESGKSMFNPNLHWLEDLAPAEKIGRMVEVPTIVMHEERALCRAQLNASDESANYIALDFSSGVGMSVVAEGEHLFGATGFAGEIGHVVMDPNGKKCGCGNRGCLETIASDRVLQSDLGIPLDEVLALLADGEQRVVAAAERVVRAQASGVAAVVNIFNPDKIFVSSRISRDFPEYLKMLRYETGKLSLPLSFSATLIELTRGGKLQGTLMLTVDSLIGSATIKPTSNKSV